MELRKLQAAKGEPLSAGHKHGRRATPVSGTHVEGADRGNPPKSEEGEEDFDVEGGNFGGRKL